MRNFARWIIVVTPVAASIGSVVAFFLWSLDEVTALRISNGWLLYLLPVAGAGIGATYQFFGKSVEAGTLQIIDEIHKPGGGVPSRMAPFVLLGTIVTHLFGGSAGREGTAVQIGGSIASSFDRNIFQRAGSYFQLAHDDRRQLLQAGMAAGFGAVFGTPIAAAVFAIEVLGARRVSLKALLPCLVGAVVGERSVAIWGVHHAAYPQHLLATAGHSQFNLVLVAKVMIAALLFGLASWLFLKCAHGMSTICKRFIPIAWLRPVLGAFIVIALTIALGSRDYLGLGVSSSGSSISIVSSFTEGGANPFSWLLKIVFTSATVGSGFKGGEVTPLFFIGATLGNTLAVLMHAPIALFAALGFVAVFSGAANTPIACTIMGVELFGFDGVIYFAIACAVAFLCSGQASLYRSHAPIDGAAALSDSFSDKRKSPV